MRIGGPLFCDIHSPEDWINILHAKGYKASYCPIFEDVTEATMEAYRVAALKNDVLISEVDARAFDILQVDDTKRELAIKGCIKRLRLAEGVGALCCVNTLKVQKSYSVKTIAAGVREILDEVNPVRTFFALEIGGQTYPRYADDFLHLMKAIDHPRFGVCLDLSSIADPDDCFDKLAPFIRSIDLSDVALMKKDVDYTDLLERIDAINPDMCVMIRHDGDDADIKKVYDNLTKIRHQLGCANE